MQLPLAPLANDFVRLVPLDESHREGLRAAAADRGIWRHWVRASTDWDAMFAEQMAKQEAGSWMH
ncbi:MAG: hypothetical protein AB7G04_00525, partial [Hyphomonadaceae bacterium]